MRECEKFDYDFLSQIYPDGVPEAFFTPFWLWIDLEGTCWPKGDPRRRKQANLTEIIEIGAILTPSPWSFLHPIHTKYTTGTGIDKGSRIPLGTQLNQEQFSQWTRQTWPCFESLVRPLHEPLLTSYCSQLTGIQQSQVDQAQSFDCVYLKFQEWIHKTMNTLHRSHLVSDLSTHLSSSLQDALPISSSPSSSSPLYSLISWGYLDYPILQRHLKDFELSPLRCPHLDAQHFFQQGRSFWKSPSSLKLHALALELGIEVPSSHRALSDTVTLLNVFKAIWSHLIRLEVPKLEN